MKIKINKKKMNKYKIHCANQYNEFRNKYCMKIIHFKSKIMLINL